MSDTFDAYVLDEQGSDPPTTVLPHILRGVSPPDLAGQILAGQVRGRVVIEIGR